jgi:galactokinase
MTRVEAYAPGRVELLGNHTDYNEGVVLGAAIDRGLSVAGERRDDGVITIRSSTMGHVEVSSTGLQPLAENRWANYALGVARQLESLGVPVPGFNAQVEGDLPAGCGLSSSAAFEVATAFFLLKLAKRELPPLDIAKLCQRAEHEFIGVQSGLLDQVCSIFGRADHALFFDARSEEVRTIPFPPGLRLVIAESGRKRELTSGLYNDRRRETRAAAEALGVRALRDATPDTVAKSDLAPLLLRRAAHVVGENDRVQRALELLDAGDGPGLGALINASHESSRTNFENSTPELDLLVEIARSLPGVLGARLTGGGFGGATVTLCEESRAEIIATELTREYSRRAKIEPRVFVCRLADGAH